MSRRDFPSLDEIYQHVQGFTERNPGIARMESLGCWGPVW